MKKITPLVTQTQIDKAELEQQAEDLRRAAEALFSVHEAYVAAGFSSSQAMALMTSEMSNSNL